MRTEDTLPKLVNDSGFPLQIAMEKASYEAFGFDLGVMRSEFPWANGTYGTSGYLDLFLSIGASRFVVSAKRVRESDWIFLQEDSAPAETIEARAYWRMRRERELGGWSKVSLFPAMPDAPYAVIPGTKDRPAMLERECALLIHALEAVAFQEDRLAQKEDPGLRLYHPVLVTTANLHVCRLPAGSVDLKSGEAPVSTMGLAEIPVVRLTKAFTPPLGTEGGSDLYQLAQGLERTVFVVTATHFVQFMKDLEVTKRGLPIHQPWMAR